MKKKIKANDELVLPDFELTFIKVIIVALQKIVANNDINDYDDLETLLNKIYHDEKIMDKISKNLFKTVEEKRIKDADDMLTELIQSFYRLRLSIKLANEVNEVDVTDNLERLAYYKENFYNEYTIFTGRVIKYLNKLKNETKEYKGQIKYYSEKYWDLFKSYHVIRNNHIHDKRTHDKLFKQTVTIDLATKYGLQKNLPEYDEECNKMKKLYVEQMISDLNYLYNNTELVLNEFGKNVFSYLMPQNL